MPVKTRGRGITVGGLMIFVASLAPLFYFVNVWVHPIVSVSTGVYGSDVARDWPGFARELESDEVLNRAIASLPGKRPGLTAVSLRKRLVIHIVGGRPLLLMYQLVDSDDSDLIAAVGRAMVASRPKGTAIQRVPASVVTRRPRYSDSEWIPIALAAIMPVCVALLLTCVFPRRRSSRVDVAVDPASAGTP